MILGESRQHGQIIYDPRGMRQAVISIIDSMLLSMLTLMVTKWEAEERRKEASGETSDLWEEDAMLRGRRSRVISEWKK